MDEDDNGKFRLERFLNEWKIETNNAAVQGLMCDIRMVFSIRDLHAVVVASV